MASSAPSRLGPYEIVSAIGKGGMGEVWKARDPRLNRDVAIKISAQEFTDRFDREARAIAALNHSNICTLYDVGPNYLVMELVEGPTLAERIAEGPIPLDEALGVARQIADALEAAHEKGIVHRDLKPANIKIRPDGSVKVLDFGLAKSGGETTLNSDSPTMLSVAGMVLGTAGYMSPEQARGKVVDKRADIWAFGVVLYEMVTGKRLFEGETISDTLAAVIKEEPDFTGVPVRIQRLLRRCLEKDLKRRLRDISGVELLLEEFAEPEVRRRTRVGWMVAVAAIALGAGLAFVHFRESPPTQQLLFSSISIPPNSTPYYVALSPDGRRLVMSLGIEGKTQLYIRSLDSPKLAPLSNTDLARSPFWSPDSRFIGFFADGKLKTIPAVGGPTQSLCDAGIGSGGSWNGQGVILFATDRPGPILRVNASGGPCASVTKQEPGSGHRFPEFLPDSRHFVHLVTNTDESRRGIYIASLDDPHGRRLLGDYSGAIYAPALPGNRYSHLLFRRQTALMAQPFDDRKMDIIGDPFAIAEQISTSASLNMPAMSASGNGSLVYVANRSVVGQLAWFDRTGKEVAKVGSPHEQHGVDLSLDAQSAVTSRNDLTDFPGLWMHSFIRNRDSRLTDAGRGAVWSPDGQRVIFSNGNDLYVKDASGGGPEVAVVRSPNPKFASAWSRDGRFLLYTEVDPKGQGDIWYLGDPLSSGRSKPVKYLGTSAVETQAQLSPDGRWVAYTSTAESGGPEVYVRPFPSGEKQTRVSTNGGREPRWSHDGKEIYYVDGLEVIKLMAVAVRAGRDNALGIAPPQELFQVRATLMTVALNAFVYSPAPDGRFLINAASDTTQPAVNIIGNWLKFATRAKER